MAMRFANLHLSGRRVDQQIGFAAQQNIRCIAVIALVKITWPAS
jgi:hypothetical protein